MSCFDRVAYVTQIHSPFFSYFMEIVKKHVIIRTIVSSGYGEVSLYFFVEPIGFDSFTHISSTDSR